ncbi:MAG: flagellar motor switch protein FliG [Roseitalea sp.]|jgi:flagellar motor switch protein FliG|nr:flagellar motor switch protein FliG [Roseitalea sp.]MBO6741354.1 flagellar motor switch protein FliG [Roseitalea sp.]
MQQRYTLSTSQKAAAVLIAMGKPRAKQLLKYFKGDELRRMIDAGHTLKNLPQTDVDALVSEFEAAFVEGSGIIDSRDAINAIMDDSLPEDEPAAAGEPSKAAEPKKSPWELIATVDDDVLVNRLANEPPQLVAALMAQLPSAKAAGVLEAMPDDKQTPIVTAMMTARDVPGERLTHVGHALVKDFKLDAKESAGGSDAAPKRVAEIMNAMQKDASETLMKKVRESIDPKKLAALESRLFRFDDMVLLEASARTLVVDGLPSDILVRALRGADADLKEAVLSSISQRARKMIESELSAGGQDTPAAIEDSRKSIAQLAMKLATEGRITLPKRD